MDCSSSLRRGSDKRWCDAETNRAVSRPHGVKRLLLPATGWPHSYKLLPDGRHEDTGREKWPVPILVQENRVVLLYQSKNSPAYRDESWCVLGLGGLGSTYWQNLNQQWKVSDLSVMLCMTSDPTRELHSKQITGFWILFKKLSNSPLLTSKMLPNNMVPFLYLWLGFKNWHAARDGTVL